MLRKLASEHPAGLPSLLDRPTDDCHLSWYWYCLPFLTRLIAAPPRRIILQVEAVQKAAASSTIKDGSEVCVHVDVCVFLCVLMR